MTNDSAPSQRRMVRKTDRTPRSQVGRRREDRFGVELSTLIGFGRTAAFGAERKVSSNGGSFRFSAVSGPSRHQYRTRGSPPKRTLVSPRSIQGASLFCEVLGRRQRYWPGRKRGFLLCLDHAGEFSAAFDLDLTIGNLAGNVARCADYEPVADHKVAVEAAMYVCVFCRTAAAEPTHGKDDEIFAVL